MRWWMENPKWAIGVCCSCAKAPTRRLPSAQPLFSGAPSFERGGTPRRRPLANLPARGHWATRARRVQGTAGSRPVSGTAMSGRDRAAQGVPRPRSGGDGVRATRRRTAIRTPLAPRQRESPGTIPRSHSAPRMGRGRAPGIRRGRSFGVPATDGSRLRSWPPPSRSVGGVCWSFRTPSRGPRGPSCRNAPRSDRGVRRLSLEVSRTRQPRGNATPGRSHSAGRRPSVSGRVARCELAPLPLVRAAGGPDRRSRTLPSGRRCGVSMSRSRVYQPVRGDIRG
jgi:hypothetical protein